MIKIKAIYSTIEEKDKLLQELQQKFLILKVSKEYKNEGSYKRIHIDLKDKENN